MNPATPFPGAIPLWRLYAIAAATFLPAIAFHYVGEEAILPVSALEMWHRGEWARQLLYGENVQHNPLPNWLIILFASLAGWEHMLGIMRAITIAATVGTGLVLAWLARALYGDAAFAAFAALVYLTLADLFFYRGWLAYADPLFGFFVFGAMACLWVACLRRSAALLALAAAALTCAFMTKALTAYAFYGAAALVLLADRRHRAYLLGPASWIAHGVAAALPLLWLFVVHGDAGQGGRMFGEIVAKLAPAGFVEYLVKLASYSLDTIGALAPAGLLAAYYAWRGRTTGIEAADSHFRTVLWIAFIGYLPYWIAPHSSLRYLTPLYPLAGLAIARLLWRAGPQALAVTQRWLVAMLAAKLVLVLVAFPYYQSYYRGANYAAVARQILDRTAGHPLYTTNDSASGLSVTANIDVLRLPAAPITYPPQQWDSGFVITYKPDGAVGRVAEQYRLGGRDLYLLCRGAACSTASRQPPAVSSQ